uniref:PLD phosphodiesterase domain-containing protein n=1 Tax=viral metagenome TaxID=1070528 RepID=A0A6C0K1S6_9ZZZZ
MYISFNQKNTNNVLFDEIKKATKFIIIHTLFFNDTGIDLNFISLLNSKIIEYPEIYIEIKIGLNPFLKPKLEDLDKKIKVILEEPRTLFFYVYHARMFHTENVFALGGIDITKENLHENYQQFALFLNNKKYFIINESNYFNYEICDLYDFVGNSTNSYKKLLECINSAKQEVFIDNQYLVFDDFVDELITKKKKNSDVKIYILTNSEESNNPLNKFETIVTKYASQISRNLYKNKLKKNNITLTSSTKYTHNKLCIVDKRYLLFGSMNLMARSIINNGDKEMSIFLENEELCNTLLSYYEDTFHYETI